MFIPLKTTKTTIFVCLFAIFALSANSFAQVSADRKKVGVLLLRQADPFFLGLATSLRKNSVAAKFDLEIVDAESSITSGQDLVRQRTAQQQIQLHRLIMEGVDALVLVPASDRSGQIIRPSDNGIAFYAQTAKRAGIPVFTVDIACTSCGNSVVAHIASNNKQGGRIAAEILSTGQHPATEIVALVGQGYSSVEDRIAGFDDYIATSKNLTVWKYLVDGRRENAAEVIQKALNEHPLVSGIFAINDETALGALQGMHGRKGIKLVGFDGSDEARRAIDANTIFCATIVQDTEELAKSVIQQIQNYFERQHRLENPIVIPVKSYPNKTGGCKLN